MEKEKKTKKAFFFLFHKFLMNDIYKDEFVFLFIVLFLSLSCWFNFPSHNLWWQSWKIKANKQNLISTFTVTRRWISTRWWRWWRWWIMVGTATIMCIMIAFTITISFSITIAITIAITVSRMLILLSILFSCFLMIIKASIRITTKSMAKIITTRKRP